MSEQTDHYFTAEPASAAQRRALRVFLAGQEVMVETAPGVFCPDRVDIGTAVLLAEAPAPPPTGNLLDLGSGWGPIALSLGLRSPGASIWAVDVNQRALSLARDNAKALGVNDFHAVTPDEVPADIRFDAIWSNPPIRVGKAAPRPAATVAGPAGTWWHGIPRRSEEPGIGLPAALAGHRARGHGAGRLRGRSPHDGPDVSGALGPPHRGLTHRTLLTSSRLSAPSAHSGAVWTS